MTNYWEHQASDTDQDEDVKPDPDTKLDPDIKPDPLAPRHVAISVLGWKYFASIIPDTIEIDLDEALVKSNDRTSKLSSKGLERLVTNITSPLKKHKFSALDIEKFQQSMDFDNFSSLTANTAKTSNILAHVESHLKNYDLANIFTNFPVLDFKLTRLSKLYGGMVLIPLSFFVNMIPFPLKLLSKLLPG